MRETDQRQKYEADRWDLVHCMLVMLLGWPLHFAPLEPIGGRTPRVLDLHAMTGSWMIDMVKWVHRLQCSLPVQLHSNMSSQSIPECRGELTATPHRASDLLLKIENRSMARIWSTYYLPTGPYSFTNDLANH